MNVLVVHNRYREPGGEDRVVDLESTLLARHGHKVVHYRADNRRIDEIGSVALARLTLWNHGAYREVRRLIVQERADLLHVHNTLPLASPAVYYAAYAERIPVVQTLHNYRLLCPNALCFRDGRPCVDCVSTTIAWPSVRHGCYRGSRAATGTVAAMLTLHHLAGTWHGKVDTYIAPTEFARHLFVSGGLPPDKIVVKPHFVDPDPGVGSGRGGYALFVGRLSAEKGVHTLIAAWSRLEGRVPLTIVGDGPMAPKVADAASRLRGLRWLGQRQPSEVQRLIGDAAFLIFPSIAYETFGQVIVEAYAAGTPVVASAGGAATDLVEHQRTGLLVRPGDADDLVAQIEWLLSHPDSMQPMRSAARAAYEARFTGDANYRSLVAIYRDVTAPAAARSQRGIRVAERTLLREEAGS
jgi:glycosyltransferase involved in cell wall biosynthesis